MKALGLLQISVAFGTTIAIIPPKFQTRAPSVVLGHRKVAEAQAIKYMQDEVVTWQSGFGGGEQLGPGVYLTQGFDEWKGGVSSETDWYCVISVDQTKLDRLPKIWIPEENEDCVGLWYAKDALRKYLRSRKKANPKRTILLSVIQGQTPKAYQILVPPDLVDSLKMEPNCFKPEDKGQVPQQAADIFNWKNVRDEEYKNEDPNRFQ
ncbi:hypothetical protein M011DRAFT_476753 [Sporormia fimetaria CBS 119925]|uniref:Uncharacterized protein n=1 Tax=Sporormia fimetaria CBS 119925 TaxID=1340428 RepID=A0A6A6VBX2_9PLEO|nr:hypothetical protein M011DRAFT_476753 [Sporormia fimetaria CBS 119925]